MKKSILMAIVALALLAAPAFAGDYSITGNIDFGWGFGLGASDDEHFQTNDFTMLGFTGSVDDNNTLNITMEYGDSGSGVYTDRINTGQDQGTEKLDVGITSMTLTTNLLGAFGLTDLPVTVSMTNGYDRLNLHHRFQQWTGWEYKRIKDFGSATLRNVWNRYGMLALQVGIVEMVNVRFAISPVINDDNGVPFLFEIWTNAIAAGPVTLDVNGNVRIDGDPQMLYGGGAVNASMAFGALTLSTALGLDVHMLDGETDDMEIFFAVKPSYGFGAGSVSLGAWMAYNMSETADANDMDIAVDVALSYSTVTLYGGVKMQDMLEEQSLEKVLSYDIGVKNSFGAGTIGLGYAYTEEGGNGADIGASDGSVQAWTDDDGEVVGGIYFRVTAWY